MLLKLSNLCFDITSFTQYHEYLEKYTSYNEIFNFTVTIFFNVFIQFINLLQIAKKRRYLYIQKLIMVETNYAIGEHFNNVQEIKF